MAVVSGGGTGIGRAIAHALAADGDEVFVLGRRRAVLQDAASTINRAVGAERVHALCADLRQPEWVAEAARQIVNGAGTVDVLVNNAGTTRDKMFHNITDELWDVVLDANLKTAYHATYAFVEHVRPLAKAEKDATGSWSHQRKVTMTSSSVALTGNPGQANYTAAKGALISLTRTLARELGPFGINVNAVAPGFVETRLTAPKGSGDALGIPEEMRQRAIAATALGRAGQPEDLAKAHLFLCSTDADFITGVTLPVTGGTPGTMR